jgi:acyl carrier protein
MSPDDARALLARLLHGVAPEVDLDGIDPAAPLQEAAELDSMDFLNLVTTLYDETGIDVPERDYPVIATIDGFVAYAAAAAPPRPPVTADAARPRLVTRPDAQRRQ